MPGILTPRLWIPPHILLDFELVRSCLVFGDDSSDHHDAPFLDVGGLSPEVIEDVRKVHFWDNTRPTLGHHFVLPTEGGQQSLPACNDCLLIAAHELKFELA